jgi:oligogalacturonide lyase
MGTGCLPSLFLKLIPAMLSQFLRCLFVGSLLTTGPAQALEKSQPTPAEVKDPPTSWIDPSTGHRVLRLTREPNSASFYFNDNGYTPDGSEMVYTTPAGISVLDLKTFRTRSVVPGPVRAICVGRKTASVYYSKSEDHGLYATNVDTGETRRLATLPPRGTISTINADETLAGGTYLIGEGEDYGGGRAEQAHPLDQAPNKSEKMRKRLAARLPLVMFTVDLKAGKVNSLLQSTDWINHLEFSPTDPSLLMYCHEGAWHQVDRIWTIHTDGTGNKLIHQRTMALEIAGHEFWGLDGKTIWYDLQLPKGEVFYVAGFEIATGKRTWYHVERNEWSIHFNVTPDGTLFCGDGGDVSQVANAPDGEWIYLFRPELLDDDQSLGKNLVQPGVFRSERLVNMSKHNYKLEPNVSFTPNQKYVIFRSNMFGPTYVFAVEVAKTHDLPAKTSTNK